MKKILWFVRRILIVIDKLIIQNIKYSTEDGGYDSERYWKDRFSTYKNVLAPGHNGYTEEKNNKIYKILIDDLKKAIEKIEYKTVLEIGCGTGIITEAISKSKKCKYTGMDITDVNFSQLKMRYRDFNFIKNDISLPNKLDKKYDLVLMIDVIQHIVTEEKMVTAVNNLLSFIGWNGYGIIGPLARMSKKHFFYAVTWNMDSIKNLIGDSFVVKELPMKLNYCLLIKRIKAD